MSVVPTIVKLNPTLYISPFTRKIIDKSGKDNVKIKRQKLRFRYR